MLSWSLLQGINLTWEGYRLEQFTLKFSECILNFQEKVNDFLFCSCTFCYFIDSGWCSYSLYWTNWVPCKQTGILRIWLQCIHKNTRWCTKSSWLFKPQIVHKLLKMGYQTKWSGMYYTCNFSCYVIIRTENTEQFCTNAHFWPFCTGNKVSIIDRSKCIPNLISFLWNMASWVSEVYYH